MKILVVGGGEKRAIVRNFQSKKKSEDLCGSRKCSGRNYNKNIAISVTDLDSLWTLQK